MASFDTSSSVRAVPNILITGTPGTGKSTTAEMVAQKTGKPGILSF
jgi:Cdc6-like AAA superfamily ATPase